MEKKLADKPSGHIWSNDIELAEIFASEYTAIIKVNLENGIALMLKAENEPEITNIKIAWETLLDQYAQRQICQEDKDQIYRLSLECLNKYYDKKNTIFPIELPSFRKDKIRNWIRFTAYIIPDEKRKLLITCKVINQDHIMKKIIDLYVYQNFDYFILLDTKNNSYTMFNGKSDKSIPPMDGNDYENEVRYYNRRHVVPEEVERTTHNMMISHVLAMFETSEYYAFNTGSFGKNGEYTRTRIQFTYYDKMAGLVLLTRSDITQLYKEEQEKERKLFFALREAKLDPMTELYNKKAMEELVNSALSKQYRVQAAVLFIDIDNFKIVNDTLGHQKGDELICYIGHLLAKLASKDGIAGRIGGDEFLLFLSGMEDISKIEKYANTVCDALKTKPELGEFPVSCSVGIAVYPRDGTDYKKLLCKADQALYHVKKHGKNKYAFYSTTLDTESQKLYYTNEQKEVMNLEE